MEVVILVSIFTNLRVEKTIFGNTVQNLQLSLIESTGRLSYGTEVETRLGKKGGCYSENVVRNFSMR